MLTFSEQIKHTPYTIAKLISYPKLLEQQEGTKFKQD